MGRLLKSGRNCLRHPIRYESIIETFHFVHKVKEELLEVLFLNTLNMLITVTSTSQKLQDLLSEQDLGILRGKYTQDRGGGGGIGKNIGSNTIYVEN